MKRLLITGFSGFVSRHFLNLLAIKESQFEVLGIDIKEPDFPFEQSGRDVSFQKANMLEKKRVKEIVSTFRPTHILHLASFSSVSYSWEFPVESFLNNTNIFLNLVEVVKDVVPQCKILSVGSSEEYGAVSQEQLPLRENSPVNPVSPYAVARVSQEMLSKVFVEGYNLDIVCTRSFNHFGAFQETKFVVPSFVKQIIDFDKTGSQGVLECGNLSIVRDFVDVRDVVEVYLTLLEKGKAGEVYNVCSGNGISLKEIVNVISELTQIEVETRVNPAFIRPSDNPVIIGDYSKLKNEFNWSPKFTLKESLTELISYYRSV